MVETDSKAQDVLAKAKALQSDNEERADGLTARERTMHELQQQLAEQQAQLQEQSDEVRSAMQSLQVASTSCALDAHTRAVKLRSLHAATWHEGQTRGT